MRENGRTSSQLRPITITRQYTKYADGSVLIEFGETKVICSATIEDKVPPFLEGKNQGWISAEYSMLPSATHVRNKRDATAGRVNPRAQEISRLIGRSLRACVDLTRFGQRQITIDCDVIQADGGTRTAGITGSFIALHDAFSKLLNSGKITNHPIKNFLAAISVGIYKGMPILDLDYNEDSACDCDVNFVMLDNLQIVEIQGTAEKNTFNRIQMNTLIDIAEQGISQLIELQHKALGINAICA